MTKQTNTQAAIVKYNEVVIEADHYDVSLFPSTSPLSKEVADCLRGVCNAQGGFKQILIIAFINDLDALKVAIAEQAKNASLLNDQGRALKALTSAVHGASKAAQAMDKTLPAYGVQAGKVKGSYVLGVPSTRERSKKAVLTQGMKVTARQIVEGRSHGSMINMLADFLTEAKVSVRDMQLVQAIIAERLGE